MSTSCISLFLSPLYVTVPVVNFNTYTKLVLFATVDELPIIQRILTIFQLISIEIELKRKTATRVFTYQQIAERDKERY